MIYFLSKENKKEIHKLLDNDNCVCLYYWTLCGHCQQLLPTWKELCKKHILNNAVNIINIELNDISLLKKKYSQNINGYPTITKYKKGVRVEEFDKMRDIKNLDIFIKK